MTTWTKAQIVLMGTILVTGKRTVTAALRVMGLKDEGKFAQYHHVLNRAAWQPLDLAEVLLGLLLRTFYDEEAPVVFGIDETIERRWGKKIARRGIYRDPVRSSKRHFVKTSGLRWISLMLLTSIPWAQRNWALPVMPAIAPSERYYATRGHQPKTLTERALQMIKQLRRWLPARNRVSVGDSAYAALDLLAACQTLMPAVTFTTRLQMDAALYEPARPYSGSGRPRRKGARLPTPQVYEETLSALDHLVQQGKVRYIGASSMYAWEFMRALGLADRHGGAHFVSMQNQYNLLYREEERDMMPLCEAEGIGTIPWSPLARGLLARKPVSDATSRAESDSLFHRYQTFHDTTIIENVNTIAEKRGITPAQVALAWLLSKPAVTAPIVGVSKLPHLEDAAASVDVELTEDEIATLEQPYQPKATFGITPPFHYPKPGAVHDRG